MASEGRSGSVGGQGWQGWIVERCEVDAEWRVRGCERVCDLGRKNVLSEAVTNYQRPVEGASADSPPYLALLPSRPSTVQTLVPACTRQNLASNGETKVKLYSKNPKCI